MKQLTSDITLAVTEIQALLSLYILTFTIFTTFHVFKHYEAFIEENNYINTVLSETSVK